MALRRTSGAVFKPPRCLSRVYEPSISRLVPRGIHSDMDGLENRFEELEQALRLWRIDGQTGAACSRAPALGALRWNQFTGAPR